MGGWLSHPPNEVDEAENVHPMAFRYPPKSGNYFGSHFIMGGERFETPQPEQYLFGENSDLNFLGSKPVPFPYPAPQSNEPTKTLKALINIRKESLKFVRIPAAVPVPVPSSPVVTSSEDSAAETATTTTTTTPASPKPPCSYNVEFIFDCDCRCEITIMYFCSEEVTPNGVIYRPRDPKMSSETIRFKSGANQVFTNSEHSFNPSIYAETDLQFDFEREFFPVVIHCVALEGDEPRQSHTTTGIVDKHGDGTYVIKPLKQKLFVDGLAYLIQEIYGIENKNASRKADEDDSEEISDAAECVICMSDVRDTLILPCRHLCLCHSCADSLRYQANNCPICRAPFRALLQIRAVYRIPPAPMEYPALPPEMPVIQMNAIPGYEMVPLLEALNGPYQPSELSAAAAALARQEAARVLNPSDDTGNTTPIAMTVMVAPTAPALDDLGELGGGDNHDAPAPDAVIIVKDTDRKICLPSNSNSSIKLNSIGHELKSPSDLEDEENFNEIPEGLPDLQDFPGPMDKCESQNDIRYRSRIEHCQEDEEEALQLQSIESSPTNLLMIAAIDEFSDEEEHLPQKSIGRGGLTGELKNLSDSSQSTPVRLIGNEISKDSHVNNNRYSRSITNSLPSTPNCRLSSAPATANSTSTRSSGDSFTSSSSTKQLLPSSNAHNYQS